MMHILHLLLLIGIIKCCKCTRTEKTIALYNDLLGNTSSDIRPGLDSDYPVEINVSLNIDALTELNEVKGFMSTVGFFEVAWYDERMEWDPDDYEGIAYIYFKSSQVWFPKMIITNPADRIYTFHEMDSDIVFNNYGRALWVTGTVVKTLCYIEIPTYPFDVHNCYIEVAPWGDLIYDMKLNSPLDYMTRHQYSENTEWSLIKTSAYVRIESAEVAEFQYLHYEVQYKRKPTFLLINVISPIIFLSILNTAVFLLPQESGEKVSFTVTVLLSFAVFLNVIGDHVPKTSSPMPYLCYYVLIELASSGIITILTIVCQRLYTTENQESVPSWLVSFLSTFQRNNRNRVSDVSTKHTTNVTENGNITKDDLVSITDLKSSTEEEENGKESKNMTWNQAIGRLDNFFFVFFLVRAICGATLFILITGTIQQ